MKNNQYKELQIFARNLCFIHNQWDQKDDELYRLLECNRSEFAKYRKARRSPNLTFALRLSHLTGIEILKLINTPLGPKTKITFNTTPLSNIPSVDIQNRLFFAAAQNLAQQENVSLKQLARMHSLGDNYFYSFRNNTRPLNLITYIKFHHH